MIFSSERFSYWFYTLFFHGTLRYISYLFQALDEAALEREELLETFEKEVAKSNQETAQRKKEMVKEFEDKLKKLEKEHSKQIKEKEQELQVRKCNGNKTKRYWRRNWSCR